MTVVNNGQTLALADNATIPAALRGYVQFALDKGILQAYFTMEQGPFDLFPTLKARVKRERSGHAGMACLRARSLPAALCSRKLNCLDREAHRLNLFNR